MKLSTAIKIVSALTMVFLIASSASVLLLSYSAAQLGISQGEPVTSVTSTGAKLTIPVRVANRGFLAVKALTLTTKVYDRGTLLTQNSTGPVDILPQSAQTVPITVSFDLNTLTADLLQRLAFTNSNLTVTIQTGLTLEPLASLQLSAQTLLPWGAPLSNFQVSPPEVTPYNATAVQAAALVSFVNNSPYITVNGRVVTNLYDETNTLKGTGTLNVSAPPGTNYQGILHLRIGFPTNLQNLMFNDTVLNYRADVKGYLGGMEAFAQSQNVSIDWGAPLKNLQLGTPTFVPYNLTAVTVSVPLNFTNNNSYISLDGTLKTEFYDSTGSLVGSTTPVALSVPIKTFHSTSISGQVSTTVVGSGSLTLKLLFTTMYGTFSREVTVSA